MTNLNLEAGQVLIFRNDRPTGENSPLWRGKARLMSGATLELSLWSNVARQTGEAYLGGKATQTSDLDVHATAPTGTVGLWANDKQGVENRPDHRGNITIGDEQHFLSIWEKTNEHGRAFLAGSVQDQATIDALTAKSDIADEDEPAV